MLKRLLWHRPRDDVAGATSLAPSCYTGSKLKETVKSEDNTVDTALSSCTSSKSSETAYLIVDTGTGSLQWMGSGPDSVSYLRRSSVGETAYTGSGDPSCAAPICSELRETVNSEVNTSVSEMGNFDLMDSSLESIPCSGMSSVDATTSSGK